MYSLVLVVSILGAIEFLGRNHRSQVLDCLAIAVVALLIALCIQWHRRWKLRWTHGLYSVALWLARPARALSFQWGVDLRREPPIPRRLPPAIIAQLAISGTLMGVALVWIGLGGEPIRDVAVRVSYLGYLVGLAALCAALVSLIVLMAIVPIGMIFDMVLSYTSLERARVRQLAAAAVLVYFQLLLVSAMVLPVWAAMLLLVGSVLVGGGLPWIPPRRQLDLLWRGRASQAVHSISWSTCLGAQWLHLPMALAVPILFALGPVAVGQPGGSLAAAPLTVALGYLAAWLGSFGVATCYLLYGAHNYLARWFDPQRPAPTTVYVSGPGDRQQEQLVRQQLGRHGWKVRFAPARAQRTDVRIHIRQSSVGSGGPPGQTGAFTLRQCELDDPDFVARVARRDTIRRRRILLRGLARIFRQAAARRSKLGHGYWVAPHYWFVPGLTRDRMDNEHTQLLEIIPPLYHRIFPHPVRFHFFEVCRALKVDLIFLEDGVGFRGLRRVLRVMFERYDIHGDREPLREIHFCGLPKIRTILHDFVLDEPLVKSNYPEPDYDDVGRARILHIFRDRGDEDEAAPEPELSDYHLLPAGWPH
jgi:hypothetical protein